MAEYQASNGKTYNVGDKIEVMDIDYDNYKHIRPTGWMVSNGIYEIDNTYGGKEYEIFKITMTQFGMGKGKRKVPELHLRTGSMKIIVDVEAALKSCEIECVKTQKIEIVGGQTTAPSEDKYDKLAKIKKLLDSGVLTQAEYDAEKKKILEQ